MAYNVTLMSQPLLEYDITVSRYQKGAKQIPQIMVWVIYNKSPLVPDEPESWLVNSTFREKELAEIHLAYLQASNDGNSRPKDYKVAQEYWQIGDPELDFD